MIELPLKPFQRATVRHALARLTDRRGSRRFLVADEVGLGKTLVAQGVIAELLRKKGKLDVFYVCSNLAIAHQNAESLLELLPPEERGAARVQVDRVTLLPTIPAEREGNLRLLTLTPRTMPLEEGFGQAYERAVIWEMLCSAFGGLRSYRTVKRALQGQVGAGSWAWHVERARAALAAQGDGDLHRAFQRQVSELFCEAERASSRSLVRALKQEIDERTSHAIQKLRLAVARAVLETLRADLVIFDEFQRFYDELVPSETSEDEEYEEAKLSLQTLLGLDDPQNAPPVLLLSATPYQLYSRWAEGEQGQHHKEFFRLLEFLFGSGRSRRSAVKKVEALRENFTDYSHALRTQAPSDRGALKLAKRIRTSLLEVMSRTERAAGQIEVRKPAERDVTLDPYDVRLFRYLRDAAADGHRGMIEPVWSSIPFPLQMMDERYEFKKQSARRIEIPPSARQIELAIDDVRRYRQIFLPHPQLRALLQDVPSVFLSLPWMPPTFPWWELGGVFRRALRAFGAREPSKVLLFSGYRAVPRAIASILSYEAERYAFASSGRRYDYKRDDRARQKSEVRGLRRQPTASFSLDEAHQLPMFLPLPTLAGLGDPLALAGIRSGKLTRRAALSRIVDDLQKKLGVSRGGTARGRAWRWALTVERRSEASWSSLEAGLRAWLNQEAPSGVTDAVREFLDAEPFGEAERPSLADLRELAELALLAPGNVLFRAFERVFGALKSAEEREARVRRICQVSVGALRGYLDDAEFHALLAGKARAHHPASVRGAVWEGNLESVLDEHLAVLRGLGMVKTPAGREERAVEALERALKLRTSTTHVHSLTDHSRHEVMRCHAAVPLGLSKGEVVNEHTGRLRNDDVRVAFNSPFRPFVVATTSIGQEGLDFHVYCRRLLHWDLPRNPVDLEQRDGRVQRYGGLAVRRVLAERRPSLTRGESPWRRLAEVQREAREGLTPWWCCDGADVERILYVPHLSSRRDQIDRLLRELALYRMALGQPDQEALVRALERRLSSVSSKEQTLLRRWLEEARINLSPPK